MRRSAGSAAESAGPTSVSFFSISRPRRLVFQTSGRPPSSIFCRNARPRLSYSPCGNAKRSSLVALAPEGLERARMPWHPTSGAEELLAELAAPESGDETASRAALRRRQQVENATEFVF